MRACRNGLTLLICGIFLFGVPAAAPADPGSPDLDSAASAVYPLVGGLEQGASQAPGIASDPPVAAETAAGDGGLPFTGLSAVLVLGAAVILLAGGGLIRVLGRRPEDGSTS